MIDASNETICGEIGSPITELDQNGLMKTLRVDVNDAQATTRNPQDNLRLFPHLTQPSGNEYVLQIVNAGTQCVNTERVVTEPPDGDELQQVIDYWEQRLEEAERKRFAEDVPRTLVESVIKERRKIRDLECELIKKNLDHLEKRSNKSSNSADSRNSSNDRDYPKGHTSDECATKHTSNSNVYHVQQHRRQPDAMVVEFNKLSEEAAHARFGSHIKPGQENTADILEAVPPSAMLQHKQYLHKATSQQQHTNQRGGTDTSIYSRMPQHHKHALNVLQNNDFEYVFPGVADMQVSPQDAPYVMLNSSSSDRSSRRQSDSNNSAGSVLTSRQSLHSQQTSRQPQFEQQQQSDRQQRLSPVRPNYFTDQFRPPARPFSLSHNSDSTTSNSSNSPHS